MWALQCFAPCDAYADQSEDCRDIRHAIPPWEGDTAWPELYGLTNEALAGLGP